MDIVFRDHGLAAAEDGFFQGRVLLGIEPVLAVAFLARFHYLAQVLAGQFGPGNQGGDFLFFLDLPGNELFHVRVIDVDDHHLGRPAGGAAGFDGARGAVADLEETHQAGGFAASRKPFAFGPERRKICARA